MSAQLVGDTDGAGEGRNWRLTGALDFETVPDLFARTRDLLAGGGVVTLDLAAVEWANSAGVALLLEWRRQAHRRGVDLRLNGVPDSVRRVARLSDVEALLSPSADDSVNPSARAPAATL